MKSIMLETLKMVVILFSLFYTCLDVLNNLTGLSNGSFLQRVGMAFFYSIVMTVVVITIRKVKRRNKAAV